MRRKPLAVTAACVMLAAGCSGSGSGDGGSDDGTITMWTVFDTSDRIAKMRPVLREFTAESGIDVKLVGVSAPDLSQTMVSAAAAGDLPDVVLHGNELAAGWVDEGILDPAAATAVVDELGRDTFSEGALDLVGTEGGDGEFATVPSDGWGQMVFYRTDLFEKAGLAAPESFEDILAAAEELDTDGVNGFALATAGGDGFTMQVFEHIALANGCQLVDDSGEVTLDSPECEQAIEFYVELSEYAPAGAGDVDTTRANYLAGQAAMTSWSPHLLDELAGLFPDTPLTCDRCANDPQWLVERTEMVPLLLGPSGDQPSQFGLTINLGITSSADTEPAQELVRYLLGDGYMDFLSISPEGRFPTRSGPEPDDTTYVDEWAKLPVGSGDNTLSVGELYGDDAVEAIVQGATGFERWGFAQGRGALVTAMYGDLELSRILREALDGSLSPAEAAAQMDETATQLSESLG